MGLKKRDAIFIGAGVVAVGVAAYLGYRYGVNAAGPVKNAKYVEKLEDAIMVARRALHNAGEAVSSQVVAVSHDGSVPLTTILKGVTDQAGIYLTDIGDLIPAGAEVYNVPAHVLKYSV